MNNSDLYKYSILKVSEKDNNGIYHISYVGKYGEFFLFTFLPSKNVWHFCCHDLGLEDIEVDEESKHRILIRYCYHGWPWFDLMDKGVFVERTINIHHLVDKLYLQYLDTKNKEVLQALKQIIKNTEIFKLSKKQFAQYIIEGEGLPKGKEQISFLLNIRKEVSQGEYKIDIVLNKEQISKDINVVCWSEKYFGKKKNAIKRAKELQKEWTAEFFTITKP